MPEKALKKLNKCILPEWKICFFSALLVGLTAHLYKITNWLPNWDSLVFRYDSQNMICLGRWFLPVVCSLSSFYDLPFLNGIIAIVFHALGAVCICKVLNIKKKITAFLIGALTVSFPTVTSVMMYNYVADGYSIAFFLSALAAVFMTSEKPRYFLSAILITLSTAIYQAYITVTIMLILLWLIDKIIYHNEPAVKILKKCLSMVLAGTLGMVMYAIILKVLLTVFSTELLDYQNLNSTASLSNINLLASLYIIKETFINFFFDFSHGVNVYGLISAFILIFTIVYYFESIIRNKLYKSASKIIMIILLSILLVLGAGVLAFINADIDYHNLMLMGYSVFYLFFIVLYERGSEKRVSFRRWTVLIASLLIISNHTVISNVSYHKAQIAYEKSYSILIRIADRIEQTPNSENCNKILVIGALDNSKDYSVDLPPSITGITDGYIIRADDETVGQSVLCSALNDYCGKNYEFVSRDEKKSFLQREDIKSMEKWPSEDCVAIVDDIVVIKLGTEGEN